MSTDELQFEKLLAYHCAPVLKKKKVANMFHVGKHDFQGIQEVIALYNEWLNKKGLYISLFQEHCERVTIYLYQRDVLQTLLDHQAIQDFLAPFHYPTFDLRHILYHLDQRLTSCKAYPHEIGIFLGYPLCDVIGFMNHKQCRYCGYWKVYQNIEQTCGLFDIFDHCTKEIWHAMDLGKRIEQVIN